MRQPLAAPIIMALSVLFLGACSRSGDRNTMDHTTSVVFFGDSLTEGYTLPPAQAYPALIQQKLGDAGLPFEVVNAGVTGDTAADGQKLNSTILRPGMALLLIAFGTNDLAWGVPVADIERTLQEIIDAARSVSPGVALVIAGIDLPRFARHADRIPLKEMYERLAARNHALLIPNLLEGVAGDKELNLPDGLHPNAAGHAVMAEHVWAYLSPLLTALR